MGWQVTSYVSGGRYSTADREEYAALARLLDDAAADWRAASTAWGQAALELARHQTSLTWCPSAASGTGAAVGHSSLPYDTLIQRCSDHAAACETIGGELDEMASLLIRAHSLYEECESRTRRLITETLQMTSAAMPKQALIGTVGAVATGMAVGSLSEGEFNPVYGLTGTAWAQEGLLGGLAMYVSGIQPWQAPLRTDEVNVSAGVLTNVTKPLKDTLQGDCLTVVEVETDATVVGTSTSVAESLENLRRLAEERLGKIDLGSGLSYATIAVQRYRRDDGTSAWLVTIPGTDGEWDSPFGWMQNIELMSDDPQQRMQADSARMVAEAMRQAGIGEDEPVALIGHSQGGIVAATIASDLADEYDIQHVVTAGSPVANHPIPSKTWVTSIEMDDELVAALDGAQNPRTDNWLTIQGHATRSVQTSPAGVGADGSCAPGDGVSSWSKRYASEEVTGASESKEITHWLKYHQAAYKNATDLGSPAVLTHERHFQQVIDGELEETHYYRGRMGLYGTASAPSGILVDTDSFGD
ncbi:alpha/beta fold hydrolase [Bifidobacterium amazonense]|uniref:Alpha/beta fold hydrolase n=1 Tax=Bifidobacterium amazonense TaxID=2809027 RepID=A0ABS9VTA1_9BIFI|nr:alpha/beta fold hydrolase [Bifidobacterium amazonense]MCH9275325.1 alpha/beta fold hydrolase [Bifidobacterium amazonense]